MEKCDCIKIGLVLEGGAMRGMYTAAVLDLFLEYGISFDAIVGVSAGALFGVNFLSKQKGRVIRYNKRYNHDKDYMGLRPFLREGNIVSTEYAYHRVPEQLDPFDDAAFQASKTEFYAVITDTETGNATYPRITSVFRQMDTLRASGSIPFISKPVEIDGHTYLDGGIADSIPYRFLKETVGCDKIVVILTRDLDYRKKTLSPRLIRLISKKMPAVGRRLLVRHEVYNQAVSHLREMEQNGEAVIIRPSQPISIGRMETDPEKLQAVYDLGLVDARNNMKRVRNYLT